jgi:MarR family transcriptional regulator, transcriptional regulator for hemolysin
MEKQDKPIFMIVGGMMKALFRVLKKRTDEQAEAPLTIEQFRLLYAISKEANEVIQKEMAEIMGKDKSAILRMTDCLEKKELVRRVVDQNDRRKNNLMVSKMGERTIELWLKIGIDLNNELTEGLSQSDMDAFFKVINHIKSKAEKIQQAP